ncbi:hypothetical protein ACGVWS_05935 [Enterobacteriaceae bacterium LUAb1]
MSISFNAIPANINIPVFYAEMDNSVANSAQSGGKSLFIGYTLPDAALQPHRLTLMSGAPQAQKEANHTATDGTVEQEFHGQEGFYQ